MTPKLSVRQYQPEDWEMVNQWWQAHPGNDRVLSRAMLPPVGIVVEYGEQAIGALWMHLSAGVGVAFLDYPVTKPGLSLVETGAVFGVALDAMAAICRVHDYGMMIANTLPPIARWMERHAGFQRTGNRVQMARLV